MSSMELFGRRIGRFWLIYSAGAVFMAVLSLAQVVVLTHFLRPSDLGRLAALQAVGALITMLLLIGTLQGTMGRMFGSGGGDDDGGDDAVVSRAESSAVALGTGLTTMATFGVVVFGVTWLLAPTLADALVGNANKAGLVRAVAAAAVTGAPFRLLLLLPRYARRAQRYVLLEVGRLVLGMGGAIALLVAGYGLSGAVVGMVAGDGIGLAAALVSARRDLQPVFRLSEARLIMQQGLSFAPVLIANFVILNADVLLLTGYGSPGEVGRYRLATSVARMAAYPVAIFLTAWGPLTRSPLQLAVERERSKVVLSTTLFRYAVVAGVGILVVTLLFANVLVRVSPSTYGAAAAVVPLLAAGYILRGLFIVCYRMSLFPRRRTVFIVLSAAAAVIFLVASIAAIPALGASGAAIARVIGYSATLVAMIAASQWSATPVPLPWWPVALTVASGGFGWGLGALAARWSLAAALVGPVAYAGLVLMLGVIPRAHLRPLARMLGAMRPARRRRQLERQVQSLPAEDIALLRRALREEWTVDALAADRAETAEVTRTRLAALLERLARLDETVEDEAVDRRCGLVVQYALNYRALAVHERVGRQLIDSGVSPLAVDSLDQTLALLMRIPTPRWRPRDPDDGQPLYGPTTPVPRSGV